MTDVSMVAVWHLLDVTFISRWICHYFGFSASQQSVITECVSLKNEEPGRALGVLMISLRRNNGLMVTRWSSGYPQMPLKLILGFEYHLGRTFGSICKKQKNNQLLKAPYSVGRRNSMGADEGRQGWSILATKLMVRTVVGRGRRAWSVALALSYV